MYQFLHFTYLYSFFNLKKTHQFYQTEMKFIMNLAFCVIVVCMKSNPSFNQTFSDTLCITASYHWYICIIIHRQFTLIHSVSSHSALSTRTNEKFVIKLKKYQTLYLFFISWKRFQFRWIENTDNYYMLHESELGNDQMQLFFH